MIRVLSLILCMSVWVVSMSTEQIYDEPLILDKGECVYDTVPANLEYFKLHYRVRVPSNRERAGHSPVKWRVVWNKTSDRDYYSIDISWGNTAFGDFTDERYLQADVYRMVDGHRENIETRRLCKDVDLGRGYNSVVIYRWEKRLFVQIGSMRRLNDIIILPYTLNPEVSVCGLDALADIEVKRISVLAEAYPVPEMYSWTEDNLDKYLLGSRDPVEGYWCYLDRANNKAMAIPGGYYRLAIVNNGNGYDIIYLDGADICKELWRPMRIKGKLMPTGFVDSYDLIWYDARGHIVSNEMYATIEQDAILKLSFPLLESELRFRREIRRRARCQP